MNGNGPYVHDENEFRERAEKLVNYFQELIVALVQDDGSPEQYLTINEKKKELVDFLMETQ